MSRTASIAICAAALIVICGAAAAADETGATPDTSATTDSGAAATTTHAHHTRTHKALDSQSFTTEAAMAGETEVQAAQAAQSKSSNDDVKNFAQEMITDHTKANMHLMDIASRDNLTVPTDLDSAHKHELDRLNAASAAHFDMTYARQMVRDHREAVALFRRAGESGSTINDDLKTFAKQTLPTLEHHLQMARTLQSTLGKGAGGAGAAK